jgi:hypothetical protein
MMMMSYSINIQTCFGAICTILRFKDVGGYNPLKMVQIAWENVGVR